MGLHLLGMAKNKQLFVTSRVHFFNKRIMRWVACHIFLGDLIGNRISNAYKNFLSNAREATSLLSVVLGHTFI